MSPLLRQGASYIVVGLLQLALDSAIFIALSAAGVPAVIANPGARASAAGMGFWLNGRFTFARDGQARLGGARLRRFVVAWLALTAVSTGAVAVAERLAGLHGAWLAKPLIEAVLALVSFVVLRHWVYRA
jgi:putative flippase GtrA